MAETSKVIKLIVMLIGLFLLTAILGIGIAVLVETSNISTKQDNHIKKQQNNPPTPPVTIDPNPEPTATIKPTKAHRDPLLVTQLHDGTTQPPPEVPSLNMNSPVAAQPGTSQYSNYQSVIKLLKKGLNTKVSPCDDFYSYTCGAYTENTPMGFDVANVANFRLMAEQLMDSTYINKAPKPIQQLSTYFKACQTARANWQETVAGGKMVNDAITQMMAGEMIGDVSTATTFPMYDQKTEYQTVPDNYTMGWLLGFPTGHYGATSLVAAYTDTNWKDPHGVHGYSYYIDQVLTFYSNTYYQKNRATAQKSLMYYIPKNMNNYAKSQGKTLDQDILKQDAEDIIALDYLLAMNFTTDETTRRQDSKSYNPINIDVLQANYPAINWRIFFSETTINSPMAVPVIMAPGYNFINKEPHQLAKINQLLTNPLSFDVKANTIVNYIYYKLINSLDDYLPKAGDSEHREYIPDAMHENTNSGSRRGVVPKKRHYDRVQLDDTDVIALSCAAETAEVLMYANARIFIDKIYPTPESRDDIRNNVAMVASSIVIGFRSMIDQLNWMTPTSKKGAYSKIENLVKNIAYPDFITDDAQLSSYYQNLNIVDGDDYLTCVYKTTQFTQFTLWQPLACGSVKRNEFNASPGITNAWYQPTFNSISFAAALLRQPFYDPGWPAAVNFGALGVIAAHELTHGFDDNGIQWDGTGVLSGWMDDSSKSSFDTMAKCVVDEYSGFCPLNKTVYGQGACIDGAQTQGENIADNGGIHAAFRAYKNFINLNGPDPALPDGLLQGFTADQLFFLGFAQVWCQYPLSPDTMERLVLVDVHSPSPYRVFGTLQNFPAFKDAFHCPANSAYAPDNHCDVWVSPVSSSYGVPQLTRNDCNVDVDRSNK